MSGASRRWWSALAIGAAGTLAAAVGVTLASGRTIAPASAQAVAQALTLNSSDLPGFRAQANPVTSQEINAHKQLAACAGEPPPTGASAQSPLFVAGSTVDSSEAVFSEDRIEPSASIAARAVAAARLARLLTCSRRFSLMSWRAKVPKTDTVSVSSGRFNPPTPQADRMFGAFLDTTVRAQGAATLHLYADTINFSLGQAVVSISVQTLTPPPPRTLERRLALLLLARARKLIG